MKKENVLVNDFSVRMLQKAVDGTDKNMILSPISALMVLLMTQHGASGETLEQFEKILGTDAETLGKILMKIFEVPETKPEPKKELYSSKSSLFEELRRQSVKPNPLYMANAIWLNETEKLRVKNTYLKKAKEQSLAEVRMIPFNGTASTKMNTWAAEKTNGMIRNVVSDASEDMMLILMNTIAFKDVWNKKYDLDTDIYDRTFKTEQGEEKEISFMHYKEDEYLKDEQAKGFLKYYRNDRYAFAALLPDEGLSLDAYVKTLTGEKLTHILAGRKEAEVKTAIPRFSAKQTVDLKGILNGLGLYLPFNQEKADFSEMGKMDSNENIYVHDFKQKALIRVNEKGTVAAAVSCMQMRCLCSCMSPKLETYTVYLDRPFLYMIVDCKENVPVFVEAMKKPWNN